MRENRIKRLWRDGGSVVNGWLGIPSAFSAEVMAHQGWDAMTVDLQHGVIDYQTAVGMLQAISTTDAVPMARVPWLDPGIIMKMLDAGAYGIICPMVNNRADAEALVSAVRYPPRGTRSFGPLRAMLYAGPDYAAHANDEILCMAMIETAEALDNLDDIMSVEGLDAIYIGPSDLSLALGLAPALDKEDKPVLDAIDRIYDCARRHGLRAGIHTGGPDYAVRMLERGFDLVTLLNDSRMLAAKAREFVDAVRAGAPAALAATGD